MQAEQDHARSSEMAEALMEQLEAAAEELEASDQRAQAGHEEASQAEAHLAQASERIEELEDAAASLGLEKDELASQLEEASREAAQAAGSAAELSQHINALSQDKDHLTFQLETADTESSRSAEVMAALQQQLAEASEKLQIAEAALLREQAHSRDLKTATEQMEMDADSTSSMHQDQLVRMRSLLEQEVEKHQAEVALIQDAASREVEDQRLQMQQQSEKHEEARKVLQHAHDIALEGKAAELDDLRRTADDEGNRMQQLLTKSEQAHGSRMESLQHQLKQAEDSLQTAASQALHQQEAINSMQQDHANAFAELRQELDGQLDALRNDGIQHERAVRAQLQAKHAEALAVQRAKHMHTLREAESNYACLWAQQIVKGAVLKACMHEVR